MFQTLNQRFQRLIISTFRPSLIITKMVRFFVFFSQFVFSFKNLVLKTNSNSTIVISQKSPSRRPPSNWKIFSASGGRLIRIIDTSNKHKANWMNKVRLALARDEQNLVACQVIFNIWLI